MPTEWTQITRLEKVTGPNRVWPLSPLSCNPSQLVDPNTRSLNHGLPSFNLHLVVNPRDILGQRYGPNLPEFDSDNEIQNFEWALITTELRVQITYWAGPKLEIDAAWTLLIC